MPLGHICVTENDSKRLEELLSISISDELARLLGEIGKPSKDYFYLDAVSKGNTGHIGLVTYRNP